MNQFASGPVSGQQDSIERDLPSTQSTSSSGNRSISIAGRLIADDQPAYLIAEIGHNHGGSIERAIEMVDTAVAAGADAVKFQTRVPADVYAPGPQPGAYNFKSANPNWLDETYGMHREKLEFSHHQWQELFAHCRARQITAFSTPFDFKSVDLLARFGVPAMKIASGDATNTPLILHAAQVGVPLMISTGGCNQAEVDTVVKSLANTATPFALLQCTCIYPAPADALNIHVIETYRQRYPEVVTGLTTHNTGWAPTLGAFALGGRIFEHHYTNDRSWKGTDNNFSLTPEDLSALRMACDETLLALGSKDKVQDEREKSFTYERRKALYWNNGIKRGQVIGTNDLIPLCPGDGITPHATVQLVGKRAARDIGERERVEWSDVR